MVDKKQNAGVIIFVLMLCFISAGLFLPGDAKAAEPEPGLAVQYYFGLKIRHLKDFPKDEGQPGKPIPFVNHQFGENNVFDSGRSQGVGMRMSGFINLDKPGTYEFKAVSNDGIRIWVDEQQVVNDPDVHSDRLSPAGEYGASSPGWKPFRALYFQRKGTARLEFLWKKPGDTKFTHIPAENLGH